MSDLVQEQPLHYAATGDARGKHVVLMASDHEYRSEETIPALARILAQYHGFECTVLFGLNAVGEIEAGASHVPGLETLADADGLVIFARFLALPPKQMKHLDAYLGRAGPVVGLRTSTHAFHYGEARQNDPYYRYDFRYAGEDYAGGFGQQVLGQSWVGHHGENHRQSTQITIVPREREHPILRGVGALHLPAGCYRAEPTADWQILTMAQPLLSMAANGASDPTKPPVASEWTRYYAGAQGERGRVFTSLFGASQDFLNDGYRRMIINGVYWTMGLEQEIQSNSNIGFVGPFNPSPFGQGLEVNGVKPAAYADFTSPIPAPPAAALGE